MRPVTHQLDILVTEIKNTLYLGIEFHLRRRQGFSSRLQVRLLQVVHIQVRVTKCVHELAGLQAGHPGHHQGEQGIGGDVEWFSDIQVGYGDYDAVDVRGALNVPFSDNLGARVAFTYVERDGYRENGPLVADGDDMDDIGVRGHLLWDISENTSLLFSADYYEHQGVGPVPAQVECPDLGCNIPIPPDPARTNPLNTDGFRDNTDTNFKVELNHSFPFAGKGFNVESWAMFANASVHVTDRFTLNGGIRYTEDEKDKGGVNDPANPTAGSYMTVTIRELGRPVAPVFPRAQVANPSWSEVTYSFGLDWHINDDSLAYVKFSKGFKSGGFNRGSVDPFNPSGAPNVANLIVYNPEQVLASEVGIKTTFLDGRARANLGAFRYDYSDKEEAVVRVIVNPRVPTACG